MQLTRKKLIIGMVVVFVNVLPPGKFCLGSKDQFSAEKINARISAKAFIAGIQKRAKNRLIDFNQLSQKMLNNPGKYQDRTRTWSILQQEEKNDDLLKWYRKEITLILRGLNQKRPEGVDDFFTKEEREAFLKCPDQIVKVYLDRNFGKSHTNGMTIFAKARKKAYTAQLDKLTKDVYPTEDEVDMAVVKRQINNLRIKILDRLIKKQKESVFSENVSTLSSNFVNPILDDAKKQLEKQGSIVTGSSGASYVVLEDIGNFIKTEITTYKNKLIQEKQGKKIANKTYEIFPSVEKKVDDRASEIAIKRFCDAIFKMNFSASKNALKKMINASLSAHTKRNVSWNSCLKSFRDSIVNQAIDNYAVKAPKDKQSDFRKFLTGLIFNSDQSCKDAMNELISRSLKQNFEAVRKEISQQQFKDFFEPLEKRTWKPSEKEIDSRYNKSAKVEEPLKMPGISLKSFNSANLLEETIEMIRKAEEAEIKTGLDALRNQMSMVERIESQVKSQIRNMSDLTIDKIIQVYTQKVKTSWSSSKFVKDYVKLFKRTQDEIRRRAKDIEKIEIARQRQVVIDKKARADDRAQLEDKGRSDTLSIGGKKPGTGSQDVNTPGGQPGDRGGDPDQPGFGIPGPRGGGKGPAKEQKELGDEMPDVILDFSSESERVYADIMFPKESKDKLRLFMDLNVNLNSSNIIIARKLFGGWLKEAVKNSKKDQQDINLYVFARVFQGNFVLYRMVYYFRECLIGALEDTGDKRIKIHWHDKLFDEPGDIEKYRGKPILPPKFDKKLMPRLA